MPYHPLASLLEYAEFPASVQPAVEAAALEHKQLHDYLAHSPYLSEQTWWKLYTAKPLPKVHRAEWLIRRPLSAAQLEFVTMHDDRSTVIGQIMARYGLIPAAQDRLATGKGLGSYTVEQLYAHPWATASARRAVAYKYWGLATLRWLATASDTELPLEEAAGLVRNWATWSATCKGHHGTTDRAIFDVLEHRPALLAAAATLPPGSLWAQAAANSRHLTDPAAEQLLAVACSVSIDNTYRALQPVIEVLTGLIANPAVTTAVADLATAQANLLVTRVPTFATKLRRATNIRKRVSRLTAKVGGRSLTAPKPESVRDGALCVNWSTTADLSVLKLLVGLRGNLLDVYNSAALAANPHLGEQAYRIAKRLQDWHYVTSKSPTVVTSREAFKANYPELSAQIELSARRYWQPSHRDNQATVGVAPLYVEEYVRPGGGYAFPLIKINSWQWKERAEALTAVAEHLANRLGDNQAAWSLVFALADQFTKDDIDMLVDACLKLTPA